MQKKNSKEEYTLPYKAGDFIKFTGISGRCKTIVMKKLEQEKDTITFDFFQCTDADNNDYPVVKIGNQIWMQENLRTTKYKDGMPITNAPDNSFWQDSTGNKNCGVPAYAWYNYDSAKYVPMHYGALYTGFVFQENSNRICPLNWHLPTHKEWKNFFITVSGDSLTGKTIDFRNG